MKLDLEARTVKLSNKEEVGFGQALLATGANVRRLNVPGAELEGIHYLRTFGNGDAIREDAAGKRVVMIGGSYIASEVAASLTELGSDVHDGDAGAGGAEPHFGARGGPLLPRRCSADHGIEIHGDDELDRFEGADGRVTKVVTKNGRALEADAVVIGAGVIPGRDAGPRAPGWSSATRGGVRGRLPARRPRSRACSPPATSPSTRAWSTAAGGSASSTGTSPSTRARRRAEHARPGRALRRRARTSSRDLSDWAAIEYVGPALEWDREVDPRLARTRASSPSSICTRAGWPAR